MLIAPRIATGIIVINEMDDILLLRRHENSKTGAGEWAFPGGKLDPGEKLKIGACRELGEEVAIEVEDLEDLRFVTEDDHWGPDLMFITHYFATRTRSGRERRMEPEKHSEMRWFQYGQIARAIEFPGEMKLFPPLVDLFRKGGIAQAYAQTVKLKHSILSEIMSPGLNRRFGPQN